MIERPSDL